MHDFATHGTLIQMVLVDQAAAHLPSRAGAGCQILRAAGQVPPEKHLDVAICKYGTYILCLCLVGWLEKIQIYC